MSNWYNQLSTKIKKLHDIPLLAIRFVLAYGFYQPATMKWNNLESTKEWFASMNYPLPELSVFMAATFEMLGVLLLALGLFTRAISLPLIFIMLVAIFTVHLGNGFAAGDNGIEIPLYYGIMLLALFVQGPGKFSLDRALSFDR